MFVGGEFYHVPVRTYDVDLCIFLDPEEECLEAFMRRLVRVFRIAERDITPWASFMGRIRAGHILVIEPASNIDFHIDIIPVTPKHEHYRILREALDNHRVARWRGLLVKIPTKEYWICLKLASFRDKDRYHLAEMLKTHHLLGLRIDVRALSDILRGFPQLEVRWNELLAKLREESGLMVDEDTGFIKSENHSVIYLRGKH